TPLDGNGEPAQITSVGSPAVGSKKKTVFFQSFNRLLFEGTDMYCAGFYGVHINPGTIIEFYPSNTAGIYNVQLPIESQLQLKDAYQDQPDVDHLKSLQFGSPNNYQGFSADFYHNGSDNVPKTIMTATWIGDAPNTGGQIGL